MHSKILFIANSHAGAIARSVTNGLVAVDVPMTYLLYLGKNSLIRLTYRDGQLWPPSGEALSVQNRRMQPDEPLSLHPFDHIVVYGFQLIAQGDGGSWLQKLAQSDSPFSDAVRTASYMDSIRNSDHYTFISAIDDEQIRRKIVSLPTPLPNEMHPGFKTIDLPSVNWQHMNQFLKMVGEELDALGVRYTPLPNELLTRDRSAVKKEFKVPREEDVSHLNETGGAIVLRHVLGILNQ